MPALCRRSLHCLEPLSVPWGSKAARWTPGYVSVLFLSSSSPLRPSAPLPARLGPSARPAAPPRPPPSCTFVTAAPMAPPPHRASIVVTERLVSSPIPRSHVILGFNIRAAGTRLESAVAKSQPVPAPPAEPEASPFCFGWWRLWCSAAGGFSAGLAVRGLAARTVGAPASRLRLAALPGDVRRARRVSTDCRRSRPAAPNVVVRRGNGARPPRRRWRWRRE